jgi:hypothetical protein
VGVQFKKSIAVGKALVNLRPYGSDSETVTRRKNCWATEILFQGNILIKIVTKYRVIQKKKYTLSRNYFTSTIEHVATCYKKTDGRTLKVIFTPYKHSM